jgi:hypothetical protein
VTRALIDIFSSAAILSNWAVESPPYYIKKKSEKQGLKQGSKTYHSC